MISVCFVCLGNICRSPTAEGVMLQLVEQRGLSGDISVDSAGTAAYHIGKSPDSRSARAAHQRGVELPSRGRQFVLADFARFDHVICMDAENYRSLAALSDGVHDAKVSLLLDFDPDSPKGSSVPDPYYGGADGFDHVLDLCFTSCEHLLDYLVERYDL